MALPGMLDVIAYVPHLFSDDIILLLVEALEKRGFLLDKDFGRILIRVKCLFFFKYGKFEDMSFVNQRSATSTT